MAGLPLVQCDHLFWQDADVIVLSEDDSVSSPLRGRLIVFEQINSKPKISDTISNFLSKNDSETDFSSHNLKEHAIAMHTFPYPFYLNQDFCF